MRIKLISLVSILLLLSLSSFSQKGDQFSLFKNRTFYKPFVSEISSTLNNISVGVVKSKSPDGIERKLALMEIHLGMDAPIMYGQGNNFRWAVSLPVSLHVLWAPFEETTAPILNNDYRFGISFTGITYLKNDFIKNISFKLTPFAHESTHLGDELSIYGIEHLDNFYRVNVSYEYFELGLTLNDPDTLDGSLLSFKMGLMGLLNPTKGYYSFFEEEIGNNTFYPSERWAEFYFQLNYRKYEGFLSSNTWKPSISVEARNRVKYQYDVEGKKSRTWNFNAFIGYDYIPTDSKLVKSVGLYFRYYKGINPHGQLRDFDYQFIGGSLVVYY